jgi:hypothetical protein
MAEIRFEFDFDDLARINPNIKKAAKSLSNKERDAVVWFTGSHVWSTFQDDKGYDVDVYESGRGDSFVVTVFDAPKMTAAQKKALIRQESQYALDHVLTDWRNENEDDEDEYEENPRRANGYSEARFEFDFLDLARLNPNIQSVKKSLTSKQKQEIVYFTGSHLQSDFEDEKGYDVKVYENSDRGDSFVLIVFDAPAMSEAQKQALLVDASQDALDHVVNPPPRIRLR